MVIQRLSFRTLAVALGDEAVGLACIDGNDLVHYNVIEFVDLSPYEVLRNVRRTYFAAVRNLQPDLIAAERPPEAEDNHQALYEVIAAELFTTSIFERHPVKPVQSLNDIYPKEESSTPDGWCRVITRYPGVDRLLAQISDLDASMRPHIQRAVAIGLIAIYEPSFQPG